MDSVYKQLTEPATEPVTLARAKKHLAIDHEDDDDNISADITAARQYCETHTGLVFGERTFTLQLAYWPDDGKIRLPVEPVTSVEEVRYADENGDTVVVSEDDYRTWFDHSPPLVVPVSGFGYPTTELDNPAGIEIDFTAGAGTTDKRVEKAILLILEYWYANPGGESALGHLSRGIPAGAIRLLDSIWNGAL